MTYDDLVCTDLLNNSLVEYKLLSDSILYIVKKTNNIYFYSVDLDVDYQTSFTRNGVTEKLVDNDIYLLGDVINFSGEATLNGNQIEKPHLSKGFKSHILTSKWSISFFETYFFQWKIYFKIL